jgi:hypothetical protein
MANKVEVANLSHRNFVDSSSRYNNSKILYYGDRKLITFETYKRTPYVSTSTDRFYVITKGTEYRPDLVSFRVYGSPSFWWKIMEANNMKDIMEFKAGANIVIPGSLF